ncbi:hypothetical protein ES332_A03G249900v1 [Gossypium tomentosum]|uniref:Uncharacterized protein n=1 Tax=Gossypium tomentosum TaxID=34277 RepID=A0A5D2RBR4_GOSTO|nr:hypothetical protein ES332_A03G249900v1 [Gossypium tomentosum]
MIVDLFNDYRSDYEVLLMDLLLDIFYETINIRINTNTIGAKLRDFTRSDRINTNTNLIAVAQLIVLLHRRKSCSVSL